MDVPFYLCVGEKEKKKALGRLLGPSRRGKPCDMMSDERRRKRAKGTGGRVVGKK